jgi:uncharacterized membrane protein
MSTSLLCEAAFSGLFGLCIVHASFTRSLQSLTVALLFGISVEYLVYVSIELIEPRLYDHANFFMMLPQGIPVYIVLLWATFLYVSEKTAQRMLLHNGSTLTKHIIIASTLAMTLDTTLEPVTTSHGYWKYRADDPLNRLGPRWLRAPLVNLMAWSCLQSGYSVGLHAMNGLAAKLNVPVLVEYTAQVFVGVVVCLSGFAVLGGIRLATLNADVQLSILLAIFGLFVICCNINLGSIFDSLMGVEAARPTLEQQLLWSIVLGWHSFNLVSIMWLEGEAVFDPQSITAMVGCGVASSLLFAPLASQAGRKSKQR